MNESRLLMKGYHNASGISKRKQQTAPRLKVFSFETMDEIVLWCCNNRRFLEYLIGRRYMAKKKPLGSTSFRGNQYMRPTDSPDDNGGPTAKRIADELGVSANAVKRAESFVEGLEAADKIIPGITFEILSGMITPSKKAVIAVGRETDPLKQKELALALLESRSIPEDDF